MEEIVVTLLGTPYVKQNDKIVNLQYKKAEALFFYLCVKKILTREEVLSILWENGNEKSARDRLRDVIYRIRKVLGKDIIVASGNSIIKLNNQASIKIDIDDIDDSNIIENYTGDFLENFFVKECYEYEEWIEEVRNEYKNKYLTALKENRTSENKFEDLQALKKYEEIILKEDPYNEKAYRDMMENYCFLGQYNLGIQVYKKLSVILKKDLGEEPEEETREVYEKVLDLRKNHNTLGNGGEFGFWGRENEIHRILNNICHGREKKGGLTLLYGEAGVGKTAIINEVKRRIDRKKYIIFMRNCYKVEMNVNLKFWHDLMVQIGNYLKEKGIENELSHRQIMGLLFPDLEDIEGNIPGDEIKMSIKAEAILNTLTGCFKDKKILLVFDDIQWMDHASKMLLASVILNQEKEKIVFIGSCRKDWKDSVEDIVIPLSRKELLKEIEIERFTKTETKEISISWLPKLAEREDVLNKIYKNTEGNALFLTETLKLVKENEDINQLSPKITNIIRDRLMDLSEEELSLLRVISCFFNGVTFEEIEVCCNQSEFELCELLDSLIKRQLIVEIEQPPDIFYMVTHQKMSSYIYRSQSVVKRRYTHKKIAEYCENVFKKEKDINKISKHLYHFGKAGEWFKEYKYKIEYLLQFYSVYHETYPYISKNLFRSTSIRNESVDPGELLVLSEKIRGLEETDSETMDLKMKLEFILGRYYIRLGNYEEGIRCIEKSIQLAEENDQKEFLINNYKQMIYYGIQIQKPEIMEKYVELGLKTLENMPYKSEELCLIIRLKGLYYMHIKEYEKAREEFDRGIKILKEESKDQEFNETFLAVCYNYMGECYYFRKDYENAYQFFEKTVKICEKLPESSGIGIFYSYMGQILYVMGQYKEAKSYITKAIECFEKFGALWGRASAETYAALIELKIGSGRQSRKHYETAREIAKKLGNIDEIEMVDILGEKLIKLKI